MASVKKPGWLLKKNEEKKIGKTKQDLVLVEEAGTTIPYQFLCCAPNVWIKEAQHSWHTKTTNIFETWISYWAI